MSQFYSKSCLHTVCDVVCATALSCPREAPICAPFQECPHGTPQGSTWLEARKVHGILLGRVFQVRRTHSPQRSGLAADSITLVYSNPTIFFRSIPWRS